MDEEAVIEQIEAGRIRRYVSDFPNPTVAGRRGCITTPHLGASTAESEDNCAVMAAEELMDYLAIGKNTAYDLLKSKKIKSIKIGRVYKIPKTEVHEYIRKSFAAK